MPKLRISTRSPSPDIILPRVDTPHCAGTAFAKGLCGLRLRISLIGAAILPTGCDCLGRPARCPLRLADILVPGRRGTGSRLTQRGREMDSNLYGAFPVKPSFLVVVGSLFGAGRPFFVPSPAIRVRGARGRVKGPKR